MHVNVKQIVLKTPRDFRRLGDELDEVMHAITKHEPGIYRIDKEKRHLFVMIESMIHFQEATNKGVRVLGGFDTGKIEIYDFAKEQEKLDRITSEFEL
jgi:hypothetical protein